MWRSAGRSRRGCGSFVITGLAGVTGRGSLSCVRFGFELGCDSGTGLHDSQS